MPSFVQYDPIFRQLTAFASVADAPAYRAMLEAQGATFIEVEDMTLDFQQAYVTEDGQIAERQFMPPSIALILVDATVSEPYTVPPVDRYAPHGTVYDPPSGTVLTEGITRITIRAPGYCDHSYQIQIWTEAHERAALVAWAANRRWELEQAGALWQGHRVATDDRSKVMIMGSVLSAQMNPAWTTVWQFMDGTSANIGAGDVIGISGAMSAHVSGLFARFEEARLSIEADEITTIEEIEAILGRQS